MRLSDKEILNAIGMESIQEVLPYMYRLVDEAYKRGIDDSISALQLLKKE